MGSEARKESPPPQLPLVVSTRDLVKWSGIGSRRLGRHLQAKGVPFRAGRGSGGNTYNLEDLELLWPELLRAVRLRMARDLPDYGFFEEP